MIVDLVRNDYQKLLLYSFPQVHQMISALFFRNKMVFIGPRYWYSFPMEAVTVEHAINKKV